MTRGTVEAVFRFCMIGLPVACAIFGGGTILNYLEDIGQPQWQQAVGSVVAGGLIGGVVGFLLMRLKQVFIK